MVTCDSGVAAFAPVTSAITANVAHDSLSLDSLETMMNASLAIARYAG
jgi:hypothetical protein